MGNVASQEESAEKVEVVNGKIEVTSKHFKPPAGYVFKRMDGVPAERPGVKVGRHVHASGTNLVEDDITFPSDSESDVQVKYMHLPLDPLNADQWDLLAWGKIAPKPAGGGEGGGKAVPKEEKDWKVNTRLGTMMMDVNNDGSIDQLDYEASANGHRSGATDLDKDRGTNFIFVNDDLSNGVWDKEDADPNRPALASEDDDAQPISVSLRTKKGKIWFEHPNVSSLQFYKTRECKASDRIDITSSSPFVISDSNLVPQTIYVRVDGAIPGNQAEGDLELKYQSDVGSSPMRIGRVRLVVVKEFGAKKFFQAARAYIGKNNSKLYTCNKTYGVSKYRIVAMCEELTNMTPLDTYDHVLGRAKQTRIDEVVKAYPDPDVIINGNFCFSSKYNDAQLIVLQETTDMCDGRFCFDNKILTPPSSDTHSPDLGGPSGKFVGFGDGNNKNFYFGMGRIPDPSPFKFGLGGLSTNYKLPLRQTSPNQLVGRGATLEDGKGIIFTATNYIDQGGAALAFSDDSKKSGVQSLKGGNAGDLELLVLDGGSSTALAIRNPSGDRMTITKGRKHEDWYYHINTYLLFRSSSPRPK